jgi:hypothetical protein
MASGISPYRGSRLGVSRHVMCSNSLNSRYEKSRYNPSHWIKDESMPSDPRGGRGSHTVHTMSTSGHRLWCHDMTGKGERLGGRHMSQAGEGGK